MCKIAKKLNAKVIGDNGEEYCIELDEMGNSTIKINKDVYESKEEPKNFFKKLLDFLK